MTSKCRCGTEWGGMRTEHCASCHETFTGTSAGDKHRTGDHAISLGPYRRRCLTPVEMAAKGMVRNARGHWTLGGVSPWARSAESTTTGPPRSDEQGSGAQGDDPRRWRAIWDGPSGFPEFEDFATAKQARQFAAMRDDVRVEVVEIGEGE